VSGPLRHVIEAVNHSTAVKVAVDLPSGLDADIGVPAGTVGEPAIVHADHTITLGLCKLGLVSAPGFIYAGRVRLVDIGIPESLCARHGVRARLLDERCILRLGQPRPLLGHKGSHGHLLIIAGSRGKTGAAQLSTRAALHTGVGLCTLAAPAEVVERVLGEGTACAMTYPYELDGGGAQLAQQLLAASVGKHALAVGPGLPVGEEMKQALLELVISGTAPLLLDADALNQLCGEDEALRTAAKAGRKLVLTPHPGEAARLLGESVAQVQADRVRSARELCRRTGAVVVLKGARTLIAAPEEGGRETGEPTHEAAVAQPAPLPSRSGPLSVCPTGNAGMGSGGMGDVLTGMMGALLAAGWPAYDAACAAVYWHGLAGDVLASERAAGSILVAGDLIDALDRTRARALAAVGSPCGWPITCL
jgi:NAD(P)H-hydrate epimerase